MNTINPPNASIATVFCEGLRQGVLRFQRCNSCGQAQTLARYACQACGSEQLRWEDAKGTATVRAVTVVSRAPSDDFRPLAPYTLVLAQLDEGPRLMGHATPGVVIDSRVRPDFFMHLSRPLIRFVPIG